MPDRDIERAAGGVLSRAAAERISRTIRLEWAAAGFDPHHHRIIVAAEGDPAVLDTFQQIEPQFFASRDLYDLRVAIRRHRTPGAQQ